MNKACLIVAPHPDDETVGAGIWMLRHCSSRVITVLHITDGSPRDMADARTAGFSSRREYAAARRREVREALRLAGPIQLRRFSFIDQESYLHFPELIQRMCALVAELRPSLVLSPAYEGGHPDHDAAALAVAAASSHFSGRFKQREYALYHAGKAGEFVSEEFLPAETPVEVCQLSPLQREIKRQMFAKFSSQQHVLKQFPMRAEVFRDAPQYDFTQPPHAGWLLYESWKWGITGLEWRRRAQEALGQSGRPAVEDTIRA